MTALEVPGIDHPEERGVVELLLDDRGVVLISWVERVEGKEIVVTAGRDRNQRSARLDVGDRVEMVWKAPEELRSLPTRLVAIEKSGDDTHWRLCATGPAVRGQRRAAVRAPIPLEVRATKGRTTLTGTTVDISEGGFQSVFRPVRPDGNGSGPGARPAGAVPAAAGAGDAVAEDAVAATGFQVADVLDVTVLLDPGELRARAEVIRVHQRQDDLSEVSARFISLHEKAQDVIRARVFAGLRDLRQRGLL